MANITEEYKRFTDLIDSCCIQSFDPYIDDYNFERDLSGEIIHGYNNLDTFLKEFIKKFPREDPDDYTESSYYDGYGYYHLHSDYSSEGNVYYKIQESVKHLIWSLTEELRKIQGYENLVPKNIEKIMDKHKEHINFYLICTLRNVKSETENKIVEDYDHPEHPEIEYKITIEKTFDLFDYIPFKLYVKETYYDEDNDLDRCRILDGEQDGFWEEEVVFQWIPK